MEDYDFIKNFSKISISAICRKKSINRSNLLNNKTNKKNLNIVRKEIESEIGKLYIISEDNINE